MTARSMLDKIARTIGVRSDNELAARIGMDKGEISRIRSTPGRGDGMAVKKLDQASRRTGIPIGQLAEWWAEP